MIILRQKEYGNKENKAAKRQWMLEKASEAGFKTEPNYYESGIAFIDKKGREVSRRLTSGGWPFEQDDEEHTKKGLSVRKLTAEEMAKENKALRKKTQDQALRRFREKNNRTGFNLAVDYVKDRGPVDKLAAKQELKGGKYAVTRDTKTGEVTDVGLFEMPVSKEKDIDPINRDIYNKYNKKNGTHLVYEEGFKSQRQEELRKYKESKKHRLEQELQNSQHSPKQNISEPVVKKANILKKVGDLYTGKSKYGKKGQAIAIGSTSAALVGGGAYLIHRHNKKKKEAENKKNQDK